MLTWHIRYMQSKPCVFTQHMREYVAPHSLPLQVNNLHTMDNKVYSRSASVRTLSTKPHATLHMPCRSRATLISLLYTSGTFGLLNAGSL